MKLIIQSRQSGKTSAIISSISNADLLGFRCWVLVGRVFMMNYMECALGNAGVCKYEHLVGTNVQRFLGASQPDIVYIDDVTLCSRDAVNWLTSNYFDKIIAYDNEEDILRCIRYPTDLPSAHPWRSYFERALENNESHFSR